MKVPKDLVTTCQSVSLTLCWNQLIIQIAKLMYGLVDIIAYIKPPVTLA